MAKRLAKHVGNYKAYQKGVGGYCTSHSIIDKDDYDIVLIEQFPCYSKDELHARESHHTQSITCVNKIKNQGIINVLGIEGYQKEYRQHNKEHLQEYYQNYQLQHKDTRKEYNKKYHESNKYTQSLQQNKKYICCCGGSYMHCHKSRHLVTQKHAQWQSAQKEEVEQADNK